MDYRYQGIILSKIDIAEVDRIYSIYTLEAGKIRALGKGVRHPNAKLAGSLEPITSAEIHISRTRGIGKITGAIVLDNFSRIKSDYECLARVFYIFGILERIITQEEKDEKVFALLQDYLEILDRLADEKGSGTFFAAKKVPDPLTQKIEIVTLGFIFKLLHQAGYGLNMENCVRCGARLLPEDNFFSAPAGGVFCPKCADSGARKIRIESPAIKLIRIFFANKLSNFAKISVSPDDIANTRLIAEEMIRWITQ
jgi:DNA repair protein RecO (recombination protein O)